MELVAAGVARTGPIRLFSPRAGKGCGVEKGSQTAVVGVLGGGLKIACVWRRRTARGGGRAVAWLRT